MRSEDGAIPPQGRKVRCASCRESWFQEAEAEQSDDEPAADIEGPADGPVDIDVVVDGSLRRTVALRFDPRAGRGRRRGRKLRRGRADRAAHRSRGRGARVRGIGARASAARRPADSDWREPPEPRGAATIIIPCSRRRTRTSAPRRRWLPLLIALAGRRRAERLVLVLRARRVEVAPGHRRARQPADPGHHPHGPPAAGERQRAADRDRPGDQSDRARTRAFRR